MSGNENLRFEWIQSEARCRVHASSSFVPELGAGRSTAAVRWACGGPHLTCICMHRRKAARERERGKEEKRERATNNSAAGQSENGRSRYYCGNGMIFRAAGAIEIRIHKSD